MNDDTTATSLADKIEWLSRHDHAANRLWDIFSKSEATLVVEALRAYAAPPPRPEPSKPFKRG